MSRLDLFTFSIFTHSTWCSALLKQLDFTQCKKKMNPFFSFLFLFNKEALNQGYSTDSQQAMNSLWVTILLISLCPHILYFHFCLDTTVIKPLWFNCCVFTKKHSNTFCSEKSQDESLWMRAETAFYLVIRLALKQHVCKPSHMIIFGHLLCCISLVLKKRCYHGRGRAILPWSEIWVLAQRCKVVNFTFVNK